ncbi:MAG: CocE/NonD family hydrolase [Paludibacter sp.]|nr:CocE/NonD family hydrolase [Paludibacter sp.]
MKLAGTLTLPQGKAKFPAVVLISGSGAQNRDEEIMGHKPFLILADYLTSNGIAVLRFDDRGTNKSDGNFQTAITPDFATDVKAAVQYLKTRKEINEKKIGLAGHSEGGIIAPMVAVECKDVNFIVLLAVTGISGSEILLRQQVLIGRANGIKEDDLKKTAELNSTIYKMIDEIQNTDTLKLKIREYLVVKSKDIPEMKIPEGSTLNEFIDIQINQITNPWMLYFIRYNPAPMLSKVKCPVLAVIGSKDLQVPSEVNLRTIENAL